MKSNYEYIDRNIDIERNLEDLGWTRPTDEEFGQWIELGEKRREKRHRVARTVGTFALIIGMCAVFSLAGTFEPESATADPDDSIVVESGMETIDTYTSQEELPAEVKEKFLLFPEMPEGYEVTEVVHERTEIMERLMISSVNDENNFYIDQTLFKENSGKGNVTSIETYIEQWGDYEVLITEYKQESRSTYVFIKDNIVISIHSNLLIEKDDIKNSIIKAVQY